MVWQAITTESIEEVVQDRRLRRPRHVRSFDEHVAAMEQRLCAWSEHCAEHDRMAESSYAAERQSVLTSLERVFADFMDASLVELESVTARFDEREQREAGARLRERLWPWIERSAFMSRAARKPRGYGGDAELMRLIYKRTPVGAGTFDRLVHRYPIDRPAAQAVRNRRALIAGVAHARARQREHTRLLSVACGPAWELHDVFARPADCSRFSCTMLDQDDEAIAIAQGTVNTLRALHRTSIPVDFLQASVRDLVRTPDLAISMGKFGFVYSMGLFDYLPTLFAMKLVSRLYEMLEPGGVLMIGNYHVSNPDRTFMTYWADWTLEYRTEEELVALAGELERPRASVEFEATRSQMFLRIVRPG